MISTSVGRSAVRVRRSLLRVSTILCTGLAPAIVVMPAKAQLAAPAPVRASIDANGVDLFLGTMNADAPVLTIGGSQGMSYYKLNRGGGWSDSLTASLNSAGSLYIVTFGGKTDTFTLSSGTYTPTEGNGATLTYNSTTKIYTYTASNGTVAHFDKNKAMATPYYASEGVVTDITAPSGDKLTFSYSSLHYCAQKNFTGTVCVRWADVYRISSVRNAYGYRMTLNYDDYIWDPNDLDAGDPDFVFWSTPIGVTAANLAVSGSATPTQSFTMSESGATSYLTVTDPMSRATVYRSTNFRVAGIKLPGSSSEDVTVTYSSGKVQSVTTPVGTYGYTYSDASGVRTVTVTDPASKVATYTFDIASSRMTSMTDATSRTTSWQYDSSGRVTRTTAPEGNYTQLTYDGRGNVTETRTVAKSGSGVSDIVATASYDSSCSNTATCNQPNSATDPRGNTTDYTYDTNGNLLTVTAPAPTSGAARPKVTNAYTSLQAYFDQGSGIVASGEPVYRLTSSSVCRTTASCSGGSDETKTVIDYGPQTTGTGNNLLPVSSTTKAGDNSLSATTAIGYDAIGNVTTVDGPLSGSDDTTTYRYDADRERVGAISPDPDGAGSRVRAAVKTTYNSKGQVTVTELGTVTGTSDSNWASFSSQQQVTATLDGAGRTTRSVLTAGGTTYGVTEYSFDSAGRPDCVAVRMNSSSWGSATAACTATTAGSNGPDRIGRTTYDDAGRPLTTITAYGVSGVQSTEATLTYTSNGKTATATDAEGNKTTYEYDGVDRLVKTRYPSTTFGAGTSSTTDYEQLTYDAGSNVTNRRLRDGTSIGATYDALNRMTLMDLSGSGIDQDITYTYDLLGRVRTSDNPWGFLTYYIYDALGRMTDERTTYGGGYKTSTYDLAGRRTRLAWPDGFYVDYDYDVTGNMTAVRENGATSGVGVLATYAYDDLGRRTSLTRGNGVTTSYSYDGVSRLTSLASDLSGSTYDVTTTLSYNPASQIMSATRSNDGYAWTGAANVNRGYTTNGLNQFTASGGVSLGYDARGNLTTSGSTSYAFTQRNQLYGYSTGWLYYDPPGRLALIYDTSAETTLDYDGDRLSTEGVYSTGAITRRYVFGAGTDEPLVWYEGSGTSDRRFLVADERGSIVAVTNASGAATAINSYDEYGIPGSGNVGRFQYTGQAWLPTLGMYYYKARMYSPTLGRFMQTDPIGYGDGMNWYNYVKGDPVNRSDPSGLLCTIGGHTESGYDEAGCGQLGGSWTDDPDIVRYASNSKDNGFFDGLEFGGFYGGGWGMAPDAPIDWAPLNEAICRLPALSGGWGADAYRGLGGSVGFSLNVDIAHGRFGGSTNVAVGLGLGAGSGPQFGAQPSGDNTFSANGFVSGGVNLLGYGSSAGYNYLGTDQGPTGGQVSKGPGLLAYVNTGASVGVNGKLYDIGCK